MPQPDKNLIKGYSNPTPILIQENPNENGVPQNTHNILNQSPLGDHRGPHTTRKLSPHSTCWDQPCYWHNHKIFESAPLSRRSGTQL